MGDDRQPAGRFGASQLLTTAPDKALAFYRELMGWETSSTDLEGMEHHLLLQDGQPVASILGVPEDTPDAMPHWHPHLNVDDVDARVEKAEQLGARVVVEPGNIPAFGRLAVIQDPTGAVLTLVGPAVAEVEEPVEEPSPATASDPADGSDEVDAVPDADQPAPEPDDAAAVDGETAPAADSPLPDVADDKPVPPDD